MAGDAVVFKLCHISSKDKTPGIVHFQDACGKANPIVMGKVFGRGFLITKTSLARILL